MKKEITSSSSDDANQINTSEKEGIINTNSESIPVNNQRQQSQKKLKPKDTTGQLIQADSSRNLIVQIFKVLSSKLEISSQSEIQAELISILQPYSSSLRNIVDHDGNTLAHLSIRESNIEYLKIIIDTHRSLMKDDDPFFDWLKAENNQNMTIFDIASQKGNIEKIKYLYELIKEKESVIFPLQPEDINKKKNSVFHYAAKSNQLFPIIFFFEKLQKKCNTLIIDMPNEYGITPLHYACYSGNKNAMELLLDLGADINARDVEGSTPLHYAIKSNSERTIKKLLLRGADKFIKNKENRTPYDLAVKEGKEKLANILYHKNWLVSFFSSRVEIGPLKANKNNVILLFIIILVTMFNGCFLMKVVSKLIKEKDGMFFPYLNNKLYDALIERNSSQILEDDSDDLYTTSSTNYTCTNQFNFTDFTGCLEGGESCEYYLLPVFAISLLSDLVLLFITVYFFYCETNVGLKKKNKKDVPSLSKLFEHENNVCVKCRLVTNSETNHCLICGCCVTKWDHHCYWLNTCINDKNEKKFKAFFYSMVVFLFCNLIFYILFLLYTCLEFEDAFFAYFGLQYFIVYGKIEKNKFVFYQDQYCNKEIKSCLIDALRYITIVYNAIMIIIIIYSLIFSAIPFLKAECSRTGDIGQSLSEYQAKLLTGSNTESFVSYGSSMVLDDKEDDD